MNHQSALATSCALIALLTIAQTSRAQDDVADVPSQDLRIGNDQNQRYFLVGPAEGSTAPESGYGLIVVLPGGSGDADFHPFVKRIFKNALPEGYVVAQPVAVQWTKQQQIVWPTAKNREQGMQFTTEEFVDAVIKHIEQKHKLDARRIFTLSWSSGGPAAYAISLTSDKVAGSFVAMSVFNPKYLPPLAKAKGQRYFIYHSPEDRICPFRMAEQAAKDLPKNGAVVKFEKYDGGHGWQGPVFDNIRAGIEWLAENDAPATK